MRILADFVKRTLVGGLLFLIPLAAILIIVHKVINAILPAADEFVGKMVGPGVLGPGGLLLLLCLGFIALSFGAGLAASTLIGRRAVESLEETLLSRVPGYAMVKSMAADAAKNLARIESSNQVEVVYVKAGEGWQIGFLTDRTSENMHAVFLPDAPSPTSGTLMFLAPDQYEASGMSIAEALKCVAHFGARRGQSRS